MLTVQEDTKLMCCELSCAVEAMELRLLGSAEFVNAVSDAVPKDAAFGAGARKRSQIRPRQRLSHRESEVLELIAKGDTYKEITDKLGISYSSVRTYITRIYEKFGVKSRAQAMACYHAGAFTLPNYVRTGRRRLKT
jgi:DNA-binding CsgD family transcriptional regulator